MTVTREEIAAFADGELDKPREGEIVAAIAADPVLAEQVRSHRALKARLSARFAPILTEPVPERLKAPLVGTRGTVVDMASARKRHSHRRPLARWIWIAGPALAASLALTVFGPSEASGDYASGPLAETLQQQLAASQRVNTSPRILLSFRDQTGTYCRAFTGNTQSGIACRDNKGWRLRMRSAGVAESQANYRMAASSAAEVLQRAQQLASGPALNAGQEQLARQRGWQ